MRIILGQLAEGILEDKWILCPITEALEYAIDEHLTHNNYLIFDGAGNSRTATHTEMLQAALEILRALNAGDIKDTDPKMVF